MTANITITLQEEKEQAKKVGLEEGEKRKAIAIANKAIAKGLDDETIIELTELTIEEIQSLRKSL